MFLCCFSIAFIFCF